MLTGSAKRKKTEEDERERLEQCNSDIFDKQPDIVCAVFGNDLIFTEIASYLKLQELKNLRQTCKLISAKVNDHRGVFYNNTRLNITDRSIRKNFITRTSFPWKTAKIVISDTLLEDLYTIKDALNKIEDLELSHPERSSYLKTHDFNRRMFPFFKGLKSLTLDLEFLGYHIPSATLFKCIAKKLEVLCLTERECRYDPVRRCRCRAGGRSEQVREGPNDRSKYIHIMKRIGNLEWKLTELRISYEFKGQDAELKNAICGILSSSSKWLITIEINCCVSTLGSNFEDIVFSSLKNIKLMFSSDCDEPDEIVQFLKNQPDLESITFDSEVGNISSVLNFIAEKSSKLYRLILEGDSWLEVFPEPKYWAFLADLKNLKELNVNGITDVNYWSAVEP